MQRKVGVIKTERLKEREDKRSQNITISSLPAVFFEQQNYQDCIATCEKAVEVGRENRADFKLIAKAFTRTGNAYKALKVGDAFSIIYRLIVGPDRRVHCGIGSCGSFPPLSSATDLQHLSLPFMCHLL